jgi:hypothetical protein
MPLLPLVQLDTYLNLPSSRQSSAAVTEGDASGGRPPAAPQYFPCRTRLQKRVKEEMCASHPTQDIMTSAMEFYTLLQFFRPLRIAYPAGLIKPFFVLWRAGTTPPMAGRRIAGKILKTTGIQRNCKKSLVLRELVSMCTDCEIEPG